ncbi:MAG: transglutaminase-like domain-containing protein [Candidatus Thorarchaeota archaeon]
MKIKMNYRRHIKFTVLLCLTVFSLLVVPTSADQSESVDLLDAHFVASEKQSHSSSELNYDPDNTDPLVEDFLFELGPKFPMNISDAPEVFWDEKMGYCTVSTNIPEKLLEEIGISLKGSSIEGEIPVVPSFEDVYEKIKEKKGSGDKSGDVVVVWVTVPSIWSIGEDIDIKFKMYNEGTSTATVSCHFKGFDNVTLPETQEFTVSDTVNIPRESYYTATLTVEIPNEAVGIKKGNASVTGDGSYTNDYGYQFIQKYGDIAESDLPLPDRMSQDSGNSEYYWEGLQDIDGFNISDDYALYHSDDWSIRWIASSLMDTTDTTTHYDTADEMTSRVNNQMTYNLSEGSLHRSDYKVINASYQGVCCQFATFETSLLRALGIPAREIGGTRPFLNNTKCGGHAWVECWVEKDNTWTWIHAEPTWNKFDEPTRVNYYRELSYTNFTISSAWDDSRVDFPDEDNGSTNGILHSYDRGYWTIYDGPNNYTYAFIDICEDASDWTYDSSWPNPLWPTAYGTLTSEYGYLRTNSNNGVATGPFFYRELSDPLEIGRFRNLQVNLEFNNPSGSYKGEFGLCFYDEDKDMIAYVKIRDWYDASINTDFHAKWYMANGTPRAQFITDYTGGSWTGHFSIYRNETGGTGGNETDGIWTFIEGIGHFELIDNSGLESDSKSIRYVGIQWRKGSGTYLNTRLHDARIAMITVLNED